MKAIWDSGAVSTNETNFQNRIRNTKSSENVVFCISKNPLQGVLHFIRLLCGVLLNQQHFYHKYQIYNTTYYYKHN